MIYGTRNQGTIDIGSEDDGAQNAEGFAGRGHEQTFSGAARLGPGE